MDTVSTAIIVGAVTGVATQATDAGIEAIKKAYETLKARVAQKCGDDSDLMEAVDHLEKKPEAKARQAGVVEEVRAAQVDQDADLLQAAQAVLEQVRDQPAGSTLINQTAGDHATQIGTVGGDLNMSR